MSTQTLDVEETRRVVLREEERPVARAGWKHMDAAITRAIDGALPVPTNVDLVKREMSVFYLSLAMPRGFWARARWLYGIVQRMLRLAAAMEGRAP